MLHRWIHKLLCSNINTDPPFSWFYQLHNECYSRKFYYKGSIFMLFACRTLQMNIETTVLHLFSGLLGIHLDFRVTSSTELKITKLRSSYNMLLAGNSSSFQTDVTEPVLHISPQTLHCWNITDCPYLCSKSLHYPNKKKNAMWFWVLGFF